MPTTFRRLILCAVVLCAIASAFAAEPECANCLEIDLATLPTDTVVKRVGGRAVTYDGVRLFNALPKSIPYAVNIAIDPVTLSALSLDAFTRRQAVQTQPNPASDNPCDAILATMVGSLGEADAEKELPGILATALEAAGQIDPPSGREPCKTTVQKAFDERTRSTVKLAIAVEANETLIVTIVRKDATFIVQYPGRARGEWRTSYGFFFVPDRDERYFVQENKGATTGDPSTFRIRKQDDREDFDFVPTVVFTFFPSGGHKRAGIPGWTAGLGYDLEKPFVFGGFSWAYNENVIFTGGLTFHRQSRLLGKYDTEDGERSKVGSLLEPSQLVEDTYGPNVYVGISFRFGDDPNARRKELEEATARAAATAATTRTEAAKSAELRAACEETAKAKRAEALAKCELPFTPDTCPSPATAETCKTACTTAAEATFKADMEKCIK